jgi:transcriptional regulator with XRE-family HTH domain
MCNFVERFLLLNGQKQATYTEIARSTNISLRALKYYIAGEREPSMSKLISLADYFNVSLDYLVGRSDVAERR